MKKMYLAPNAYSFDDKSGNIGINKKLIPNNEEYISVVFLNENTNVPFVYKRVGENGFNAIYEYISEESEFNIQGDK